MMKLVTSLPPETYSPRTYIMAETDRFSETKVEEVEKERLGEHVIVRVPRAREVTSSNEAIRSDHHYHFQVGQSYVSSVFSTLKALKHCLVPVISHQPQLLLVNGPGTCLPVAIITWLLHVSRLSRCQIIFVESLCRVKTLSLTGKILQHFATESLVLWPELAEKYPKTKYIGKFL